MTRVQWSLLRARLAEVPEAEALGGILAGDYFAQLWKVAYGLSIDDDLAEQL